MSTPFLQNLIRGVRRIGQGAEGTQAMGGYSHGLVNDIGLGRYFEMVAQGMVYTTIAKAVTIAATHNTPIAANTATPVVGFGNPAGSGKAAVLLRSQFVTTSGTPAGGQVVLNVQPQGFGVLTAAATGTITNNLVSPSSSGSKMKPLNNIALAGWLVGPNAVQEVGILAGATAAAAAGNGGVGVAGEDLGGLYIITPGDLCAVMAGTGAGTSWIVNAGLTWVEIDWPL